MKRNGMCPVCYIKQILSKPAKVSDIYNHDKYNNGVALTPPMGWSSWNTFRNRIDQDMIYDHAVLMKEKGLVDAGYQYLNLDDNWHSSLRDQNGDLQGDLTTFSAGIPDLVQKINALGIKVGIYSSNGTATCEDLPASLYNERRDALTFARWGVEYFKYDFCHNEPIPSYAPLVYGISVAKFGSSDSNFYPCTDAKLDGLAKFMPSKRVETGTLVSGLDAIGGSMTFDSVTVDSNGTYILTIDIRKKGQYRKHLMAVVNGHDTYHIPIPSQKIFNKTARFQVPITLVAGTNSIKLFNPIATNADSAMFQYTHMGKMLKDASKQVAKENNAPEKPIVFSICEWGRRQPWLWGASAGNLWRTTPDIRPRWSVISMIYEKTAPLSKHGGIGGWNDPDMLEVGNGKLTYNENVAHFSVWCMLCAPLILGNDLRIMPQNVLDIVTNKNMIAINQDKLGVPARRIKRGLMDTLAKPLADGSVALCYFNKYGLSKSAHIDINKLIAEDFLNLGATDKYQVGDMWDNAFDMTISKSDKIKVKVPRHATKVFVIRPISNK